MSNASTIRLTLTATLLVGLLMAGCAPKHQPLVRATEASAAVAPRIQVLQADAMVIDGQHIHLSDAAAPQAIPHAHCAAEASAAHQGRLRIEALASAARTVSVTPTGGTDMYNRTEAVVMINGVDPAQVLIDEGLAVKPSSKAFDWCGSISDTLDQAPNLLQLSML